MAIHATERHLLFGILALQNGLIDQANLIAAFQDWTQDKSRPLAQILVDRGALDETDRLMLDPLLRRHLQKHGDDAERSLAAVPRLEAITAGLRRLADPMFDGTLDRLPVGDSGQATILPGASQTADWGVGEATGDGRFRVVRPLAKGGIGLVSVAVDGELHREVALKEIRPEQADDPRSRARFLLEAEVTGRLEHPGIVPVYGLGTDAQGRPFYAMRLVRGDSLQEAIDRFHRDDQNARREPGERALALRGLLGRFVDVCNAVAYAHARGVIHRDLKPSNILLGPYGETLVVDWGLAKVVGRDEPEPGGPAAEVTLQPTSGSGSSETVPGSVIGTPAYMSPEQAEGRLGDIGPSSDVYSLGATLFSLLTGQPPVADREVVEVLRKVQRGDLIPARQVNPRVPKALEAVVGKAMALRPTGRYGSARSLAADIDHWLAGEPVSAWHEPWTLRARRWIRRHQATATGVAAAVVVAVAGLMAVSIVQAEANRGLRVSNTRLTDSLTREASTSAALRAANVRERASREQAQRRFGLARQAIEQYYTGASEDVLLKEPELEALRKKLLGTSLAFYKRLQAELEGSDDPATRSELAAAYLRVGEITAQVGQTGEALEAYERARAIREALVQADPSADGPRRELSRSLESSGTLLVRISGRTIEGLQRLESALALRQALAAGPRAEADDRLAIAQIHRETANGHRVAGRGSEELRSLEQARDVAERLVADRPGDAAARQELARIYQELAYNHQIMGRLDVSIQLMERALALQEQLAAEHPDDVGYLESLGRTLDSAGVILRNARRPAESLPYRKRALEVYRRLEADYPTHTGYRYAVARGHLFLGVTLIDLGRMAEALQDLEPAAAILERVAAEHPGMTSYREDLAYAQMNLARAHQVLGRPAEARCAGAGPFDLRASAPRGHQPD